MCSGSALLAGVSGNHATSSNFGVALFMDGVAGHPDFLPLSFEPLAVACLTVIGPFGFSSI